MSLKDLGKNDVSEETQALKDKLASRETENAGLRSQLMKREAELEEIQATLNETVYKLSKEAERALQLEEEVSTQSSELKTERMSLRNTELALQTAQERLKAEERAKKELESTLDTVSLHSQTTSAEHQSVQREKRALESRVRELERIVQTHETKGSSNVSRKNGRSRSSSVSNVRLPAVEQELNDTKAQLHAKETNLKTLERKLAQAQEDLVKAENARISMDKVSQKRVSELESLLERREEELESLREMDNAGEREEELLKRIDEDAAKIVALEKLASESHASQPRIQKLQSQLKAECDKARRREDQQNRLLHEKEELLEQYEASQCKVEAGRELLMSRELQIQELETKYANLAELHARCRQGPRSFEAEELPQRPNSVPLCSDQSALADHIQTLLQAIDRLREERDGLKRALEFSEVEYRITTEGFQSRIASLTGQLAGDTRNAAANNLPSSKRTEQRMKQLTKYVGAFTIVISNLQTRLELTESHLSVTRADLASANGQLHDAFAIIDGQKQSLITSARGHDDLRYQLDSLARELSESGDECTRLRHQMANVEMQAATAIERIKAAEDARDEAHQSHLSAEHRFASLNQSCQVIESERNSLALQIMNLQDDLGRVRDELSDAQTRYNALHAQQLSAMSTSQVVQALKDRIQELEERIIQCTDQIGDYQRDIRHLEANAKLQEERNAEIISELELLVAQKEAMVEDCAQAREARDHAVERLEASEEEVETLQRQLQEARSANEDELFAMSSMVTNLKSENQKAITRIPELEDENARFMCELETLKHEHQHLNQQLDTATSLSRELKVENSRESAKIQQAVISLAVIHHSYRGSARRLQMCYKRLASCEAQLATVSEELHHKDVLIDSVEQDKQDLLQQLSDISTSKDKSQEDRPASSRSQGTAEVYEGDCNVEFLREVLREKEQELAAERQSLEEIKSHYSGVEAKLRERIAEMTMELEKQTGHAGDVVSLQVELQNVKTRLETSQENFDDLEKLHGEVIQELATLKEAFDCRLTETEERICVLDADHRQSLATIEAKYSDNAENLARSLKHREHEIDDLRQRLQDVSEAHASTEDKLRQEMRSYEAHHTATKDVENGLRGTITDLRQRLAQAEDDALTLQEERQALQVELTGLQAEGHRSASLTRYLESQVRESENACLLLKEDLGRLELSLAESDKASKVAEFNRTLQASQHEKEVTALRREIAFLEPVPELRSALANLEEKNQEMDDLLRAKCQEIEEYDDRILETLKANKKLTSKVESLTRKFQALQAKLVSMKAQPREPAAEIDPSPPKVSPSPPVPVENRPGSSRLSASRFQECSAPPPASRSKTPEPRTQNATPLPPSCTPASAPIAPSASERSAGKKRPAPDDDERDSVPAEGHYSTDASLRNGPTPRLRRAHGHPAGFTPVRGASLRKTTESTSPGRRVNSGVTPAEIITDVTNNPRGTSGQGDVKKRSWLGKIRSGAGVQPANSRMAFGGQ